MESAESGNVRGLSENYLPVVIPGGGEAVNELVRVRIEKVGPGRTVIAKKI